VASEVVWWMGRRGNFDPDAVDLVAAASRLGGRPALFVCNSGDRRMPPEIAFELKAAAGGNARVLVVPGNSHGGAWREGTAAYEKAVADLLNEAAGGTRLAAAR
jgi:pimeloyl-ACP methyl ester carboxylesterase